MADQSIPQLPVSSTLTGQELTVVVQNGVTRQAQVQNFLVPGNFTKVSAVAGTPITTPTAVTGLLSSVYDTTNNIFYVYSNGLWRNVSTTGGGCYWSSCNSANFSKISGN